MARNSVGPMPFQKPRMPSARHVCAKQSRIVLYRCADPKPSPERLAGQPAVQRHLPAGDILPLDPVPRRVRVHEPLEGQEPHAVRLRLAQHRHRRPAVQPPQHAGPPAQLPHAVPRPRVQPRRGPVRLRLQPDAHVLDRPRQHAVGHAREGPRRVVLPVAQLVPRFPAGFAIAAVVAVAVVAVVVALLEPAPRRVEGAELDRHARADAQQRRQRALVEGQRALVPVDGRRGRQGGRV
ncbi:hypothetical protein VTK26DRAFT_4405 [Humicola hyalothermophila]